MWADGLRTGDIFFYHPAQRTYLVWEVGEVWPHGCFFKITPYTPLTELAFYIKQRFKKPSLNLIRGIVHKLLRKGYVTAPEGIRLEWWPFVRTFTLNPLTRRQRREETYGFANKEVFYREQVRRMADDLENPEPHPYFQPHKLTPSCSPLCANPSNTVAGSNTYVLDNNGG